MNLARTVLPVPVKRGLRRLLRLPVPAPPPPPPPEPPKDLVALDDPEAVRAFVRRTDAAGGPDEAVSADWWANLECRVPEALRGQADRHDALSAEYFAAQERLYETIVGAPYRETTSELTPFDKEAAVARHVAYPMFSPENLNRHFAAMVRMVETFDRPGPLGILEAGSGWGFAAEYLARLGHRVVGVDINPDFIETATRRSRRLGLDIDYRLGSFVRLPLRDGERFDVVFTSAAFHHCRSPLEALRGMVARLAPGGMIILASEPFIPPAMWPSWGLRTDPLSMYCIAKFGWWEAGWTREHMAGLFELAGLTASFVDHHTDLERYMIGRLATGVSATPS
jgi:SAM-dependent methyltransferase